MIPAPTPGETSERRARVTCSVCGRSVELARLREHLRSEHSATSADVDSAYLSARIEARRSRRSQTR
ncbi:MAG TPA: hypothetical protein VEL82_02040 [Thermoplasmata archaeon]|nr:hypothetical protein [Thermoplasmata archaeon]